MKFDKSIVEDHVFNAFTEEEVASAQYFASKFAVEQMDSTLLWDKTAEAKEQWLEENLDKFHSKYHSELEETIRNPRGKGYSLLNGNAQGWKEEEVGEPIYVPDQPRLAFTDAELTHVDGFLDEAENNEERLRFDYEFNVQEDGFEDDSGFLALRVGRTYVLARDSSGGWLITAWIGPFAGETISEDKFDPSRKYAQQTLPDPENKGDGGE